MTDSISTLVESRGGVLSETVRGGRETQGGQGRDCSRKS